MSLSEITTIVVLFHMSHYRTFKHFYQDCVVGMLPSYFPQVVSYSRFIELMPSALTMMTAYLLSKSGKKKGLYYLDSTTLAVCHPKRIKRNKVFKGIGRHSKSTMGWFFGFKLHIEHTRHRSPVNFLVNIIAGLVTYAWRPNKPSVKMNKLQNDFCALIPN